MIRAFLPALLITLTSAACPNLKSSGTGVPFRPPGWVFGVVWPILYVTTGYAWYLSKQDFLFSTIVNLCCLWLFLYSCNREKGTAAAIITSAAAMTWYTVSHIDAKSKKFLTPLAIWLTFATYLNLYEWALLVDSPTNPDFFSL